MTLRLLLLQARHGHDPMRGHELECFTTRLGLRDGQVVAHDLLSGPPPLAEVRRYDALLMGGSGDFYVSQGNQPGFEPLLECLREVVAAGHPTFASCYGYQAMVHALGGEVISDPAQTEVGTFELTLTDDGAEDPVLGALPRTFLAQQGHRDRALRLPENTLHLAFSERCPHQAMRVAGQPIWAMQFHPELDRAANRMRYQHYLESYATSLAPADIEAELERFVHSPDTSRLLARFLDVVFG